MRGRYREYPRSLIRGLVAVILLLLFQTHIHARTESPEPSVPRSENVLSSGNEVNILLDRALSVANPGHWEEALEILEEARKLAPMDHRIDSYRNSIIELSALDKAQQSWENGTFSEVNVTNSEKRNEAEERDETPKFVIDHGENNQQNSASSHRDTIRFDIGIKAFSFNPLSPGIVNTWSSVRSFFYTSSRTDLRYWMSFLDHSFGFNFRSSGYAWEHGSRTILFNFLDLGINLRGFLLEKEFSRLEIGIDFGGSMLTRHDALNGIEYTWALYLEFWGMDPLFYHIFNIESLKRLIFGTGIRIYGSNSQTVYENVNYRLDFAWYFKRGFSGIRFEWWNSTAADQTVNAMSFSIFGGFRY